MSEHSDLLGRLYRSYFHTCPERILPLRGDGSARKLYRIIGERQTCIGVIGENIAENRAFTGFSAAFHDAGLAVPEIYTISADHQAYIEQDLGDETVFSWLQAHAGDTDFEHQRLALYREIVTQLPRFQIDAAEQIDYGLCYQTKEFGREQMEFDVRYFMEMFLDLAWQQEYDRDGFFRDASVLIDYLLEDRPHYFLYRDFQSRNIMIHTGNLYFIDYQSGRRGALQYDIASLLYDAKAQISSDFRTQVLKFYVAEVERRIPIQRMEFIQRFYGFAAIRAMQAMGAYGNLGVRQKKPGFASSISLAQPTYSELVERCETLRNLPVLQSVFTAIAADSTLQRYSDIP